jgi:hypothetical protein
MDMTPPEVGEKAGSMPIGMKGMEPEPVGPRVLLKTNINNYV